MDEFQELLETGNLVARIQMASSRMDEHRRAISRLASIRGAALVELRHAHPPAELARLLGVTRQQVHRLLREAVGRDYRPEDHEA